MKVCTYSIIFLLAGCFSVQAQYGKQRKADKLYQDLAFYEAANVYKELLEKDYNPEYNQRRLGDTYIMLRSPENAVIYYEEVVQQPEVSPEYYYKFAQALRGVKRYEESKTWLRKYLESGGESGSVEKILKDEENERENKYRINKVDFNSEVSDFGLFEKDENIFFVSARAEGIDEKDRIYSWNGEPYLDIYQLDSKNNEVSILPGEVNTKLHDGPAVISPDGQSMYFNRNNYLNKREGKRDKNATNHLKIYKATLSDNSWGNIRELPINSNAYSVGHPALSPDGKSLYFTSDMPGGEGGTDLYKIDILGEDSYSKPQNLGSKINTSRDENFPFLDAEGILYFSSNGHGGLGLFDIFRTEPENPDAEIENMGEPINSSLDDFSFFKSEDGEAGYIASNRSGGSDDIYSFQQLNPLVLRGQVLDAINQNPVAKASIRLFDKENNQLAFLETDAEGHYHTEIKRNKTFPIEAKQIEYQTFSDTLSTWDLDDIDEWVYNISLQPVEDVEYLAEINNIYFDFDKSDITPNAAEELDKLVNLMKNEYPNLALEIASHTDLRGNEKYNEDLAERRAKATYDYLISKGINKKKLAYKSFGERQPAVACEKCDEKEHQLNRRSMFKVVKMK